jgi:hypothetical protein
MTIRTLQYKFNGTWWSISGEGHYNKGANILLAKAIEAMKARYAFVDVDKIVSPKIDAISVTQNMDGKTLTASATVWVGNGQKLTASFPVTEAEVLQGMLTPIITE